MLTALRRPFRWRIPQSSQTLVAMLKLRLFRGTYMDGTDGYDMVPLSMLKTYYGHGWNWSMTGKGAPDRYRGDCSATVIDRSVTVTALQSLTARSKPQY